MDERQRGVLQKCSEYLIKNVRPLPLVDKLLSSGVLTADDAERLTCEATTNDKNRLLFHGMLPRAGPEAFSSLVTALRNTEQSYIAGHLLAQLDRGISKGFIT